MEFAYQSHLDGTQMVLGDPLVSDHCLPDRRSQLFSDQSPIDNLGLSEGYEFYQSSDYKQFQPPSDLLSLTDSPTFPTACFTDDLFRELENCFDLDYINTPSNSSSAFSSSPSSPFTLSSPCLSSDDASDVHTREENRDQYSAPQSYLPVGTPPLESMPICVNPPVVISPNTLTNTSNEYSTSSRKRTSTTNAGSVQPKKTTKLSKKERKREQNKTAATRYRQKKKEEGEILLKQQCELEEINRALHSKVDKLTAEISYLKGLWSEVTQARRKLLSS